MGLHDFVIITEGNTELGGVLLLYISHRKAIWRVSIILLVKNSVAIISSIYFGLLHLLPFNIWSLCVWSAVSMCILDQVFSYLLLFIFSHLMFFCVLILYCLYLSTSLNKGWTNWLILFYYCLFWLGSASLRRFKVQLKLVHVKVVLYQGNWCVTIYSF